MKSYEFCALLWAKLYGAKKKKGNNKKKKKKSNKMREKYREVEYITRSMMSFKLELRKRNTNKQLWLHSVAIQWSNGYVITDIQDAGNVRELH